MPYEYICESCKNRVEASSKGRYNCPSCSGAMQLDRATAPEAFRCTHCNEAVPGHPDFLVRCQVCERCGIGTIVPVW